MVINIIRDFGDEHKPVRLGRVSHYWSNYLSIESAIEDAWIAFQKTQPDSDSEFIKYLCEKSGFNKVSDEEFDVIVGS